MFWSRKKNFIVSLGWNCYPGWLIRDVIGQPSCPWDWMQFFCAEYLAKFLTEEGIHEVVESFEVKNVVDTVEMNIQKPHFWSEKFKIRSPHDHNHDPFSSIVDSRLKIRQKIDRRLKRLQKKAEKYGQIIFLANFNKGNYGIPGYDLSTYINDMVQFLSTARHTLHVSKPPILLLCNPILRPGPDHPIKDEEDALIPIVGIDNGFYIKSEYFFEDAYFQKTENSNQDIALKYWKDKIETILDRNSLLDGANI